MAKRSHAKRPPDSCREALRLVRERAHARADYDAACQALQAEFAAELEAAWKQAGIRGRFEAWKAAGKLEQYGAIRQRFEERAARLKAEHDAGMLALEAELRRQASAAAIPRTKAWHKIAWVYGGAYRSMGGSSHKYAHQAARQIADCCAAAGIPARAACLEYDSHDVEALCTPESWEIIRRKRSGSLREWLRSCLKAGCNPRVFDPFLPAGIEEKSGLDLFGNDMAPRTAGPQKQGISG